MLKKEARNRVLTEPGINRNEVLEAIDDLLYHKKSPDNLPPHIVKSVMSELNSRRKDAILHHKDSEAAKIDDLLGQLTYGPMKYQCDTPENPRNKRARDISVVTSKSDPLYQTGSQILKGTSFQTVDSSTRQAIEPLLKSKRIKQIARSRYAKSLNIDHTVDNMIDYSNDSRRLGPRLQKVQEIQKKLDVAREEYAQARAQYQNQRQTFNQIQEVAKEELEISLKDELVELGSHIPNTLPLEYSKFSGKTLDARERSYRAAQIRKYDDAAAIKKEVLQRERDELEANNEKFVRSYNLQKQKIQDRKRESFDILWQRKRDKAEWAIQQTMLQKKRAVENLERQLEDAQSNANQEIGRIKNNQRVLYTPLNSRPKVPTFN